MADQELFPPDVPGAHIDDVVTALSDEQLHRLIGADTLGALNILEGAGKPLDAGRLSALLDHQRILRDPKLLQVVLDVLPGHKLTELAQRLGVSPEGLPAALTDDLGRSTAAGFLALRLDPDEQQTPKARIEELKVNYGLFPHQRAVCHEALEILDNPLGVSPAALIHMPTGSGKTRTASHLVARHLTANHRAVVVWLANSKELLEQAANDLERAWENLGDREIELVRYWGSANQLDEIDDGIVVAGLQKLWAHVRDEPSRLNSLASRATLIVVDEAHISLATTYRTLIETLQRRPDSRLLGLTATPGRTWNDPQTDALLSEMYQNNKVTLQVAGYENPVEHLMDEGYLARPTFELLDLDGASCITEYANQDVPIDGTDYDPKTIDLVASSAAYLAAVVRSVERLSKQHRRIIVFAASVGHAEAVASLLRTRGLQADAVTGDTPRNRRAGIIRRFKDNGAKPRIIANFGVLTTGFDAPSTSAAVIARPTKSLVLYSQMVGRSIRGVRAGGNDKATIETIVDPELPGFGSVAAAFVNWEDVW